MVRLFLRLMFANLGVKLFKLSKIAINLFLFVRTIRPEAVVLSFEEFKNMQEIVEAARREQLGQQMVCDLLDIAQLTGRPIKHMLLNKKDVFEEAEGQ